jgi:co-chaperonin GroES (HSP10)/uncharacterized protein YacL (UPF0231 family)
MSDLKRSQLGNQATEQAAFEGGADAESINRSSMPSAEGAPIEADVRQSSDGLEIVPKDWGPHDYGPIQIDEGPHELMKAQMMDEPDVTGLALRRVNGIEVVAQESRLAEVNKRAPREMLIWYGAHPDYFMGMTGDRILVRKDVLELEDACKQCHGNGYLEEEKCARCGGEQFAPVLDAYNQPTGQTVPCPDCVVLGYDREQRWSCGRKKCDACNGSGWRAGIIIPEVAESKPITGVVVSVGPECRLLKLGDRVIHSRFAGHELTVSKTDSYVMMRESEILSILKARTR